MRRSPVEYKGNFVIESTTGDIYAADRLKVTEKGTNIYLGAIQTGTVAPEEISAVHQLEKGQSLDLSREKSKIAASFLILERLIEDYTKTKGLNPSSFSSHHGFCIFGACSLALTLLPERTSEDIDLTAPEDFVDFVNEANAPYTELSIEVLPPTINQLLGNWHERATKMLGYKGTEFLVLHPLDTVTQKLLRISEEKFEIKDKPDIKAILTRLGTPEDSLRSILTENALRYYPNPLGKDEQNIAVERNTRWFCKNFLTCNYEELVKQAIDRLHTATARIGHGDKTPSLQINKNSEKLSEKFIKIDTTHNKHELRSLAMHTIVKDILEKDPSKVISFGLENISRWEKAGVDCTDFETWRDLLNEKGNLLNEALVGINQQSIRLRQSSPFAGLIPEEKRLEIVRKYP